MRLSPASSSKKTQHIATNTHAAVADKLSEKGLKAADIAAEYNSWEEQDHLVRDEWTAACNNHEIHMRSFMINRQKMMK